MQVNVASDSSQNVFFIFSDSETGHILANECNKPRTRKAGKELERYHTPRFEEHQSGLGRRRTLHLR